MFPSFLNKENLDEYCKKCVTNRMLDFLIKVNNNKIDKADLYKHCAMKVQGRFQLEFVLPPLLVY